MTVNQESGIMNLETRIMNYESGIRNAERADVRVPVSLIPYS